MRVWVIGRAIPTKKNNMAGSFELEQAQMLARHGCEVYYLVLDIYSIRRRKLGLVKREIDGVNVITLSFPIGRLLPARSRNQFSAILRRIEFAITAKNYGMPDVVHVHYPALYSYSAFRKMKEHGAKIICTEHWTKVQDKTLPAQNVKNLTDFADNCDAMLCVGERLAKSVKELTNTTKPIEVIPNIVSENFTYQEKVGADGIFRFVGVGRLVACKRFDMMIRAFADAFNGDSSVRLDIIGGGEEYDSLKRIIHECGCDDQITLLGTMDRNEVAAYYHQCDALVMSSNLETFGVPIIEAMASGLPVITTDAMGFPSLFHEEHGYIIPMDQEEALMRSMRKLYENYSQFDKKAISQYAKKTYGEDMISSHLLQIYR